MVVMSVDHVVINGPCLLFFIVHAVLISLECHQLDLQSQLQYSFVTHNLQHVFILHEMQQTNCNVL